MGRRVSSSCTESCHCRSLPESHHTRPRRRLRRPTPSVSRDAQCACGHLGWKEGKRDGLS